MSVIPQFKNIFIKHYLHRSFIISMYVNLKRQHYTHKFKGIIEQLYLFLCWNQFSFPRHKVQDDIASQIQESLHKAWPLYLTVTSLHWKSQLYVDLLKILFELVLYQDQEKKKSKKMATLLL